VDRFTERFADVSSSGCSSGASDVSSETASALLQPNSRRRNFALPIFVFPGRSDEPVAAAELATTARSSAIEVAAATAQTEARHLNLVLNVRVSFNKSRRRDPPSADLARPEPGTESAQKSVCKSHPPLL
jgi:hypothetical protein